MKKLSYLQNFDGDTYWVDTPEFKGTGSYVEENGTETFAAYLNDIIIGRKFRSLGSAMRAMDKAAGVKMVTKKQIKEATYIHPGYQKNYSVQINGIGYSSSRLNGEIYREDRATGEGVRFSWVPSTRQEFTRIVWLSINGI